MTTTQMVNEVMYRRGPVHPYTPSQLLGAMREMFAFRFSARCARNRRLARGSVSLEQLLAGSIDPERAWFHFDEQGNYVFDREKMLAVLVRELDAAVGRLGGPASMSRRRLKLGPPLPEASVGS